MNKKFYAMKMATSTLCVGVVSFDSLAEARAYAKANGWNRIACAVNNKFYCDCKL